MVIIYREIKEESTDTESQKEPSYHLKMGVNGEDKNLVLLSIKTGRCWNFKENFSGEEPELDFSNVIWIKWGNPCTGRVTPVEEGKDIEKAENITAEEISEVLSYFGDLNIVKDSLVSWYAWFKEFDYESFTGDYDCRNPLYDEGIIGQIDKYLNEELSKEEAYSNYLFQVVHYDKAEKFDAEKEYK